MCRRSWHWQDVAQTRSAGPQPRSLQMISPHPPETPLCLETPPRGTTRHRLAIAGTRFPQPHIAPGSPRAIGRPIAERAFLMRQACPERGEAPAGLAWRQPAQVCRGWRRRQSPADWPRICPARRLRSRRQGSRQLDQLEVRSSFSPSSRKADFASAALTSACSRSTFASKLTSSFISGKVAYLLSTLV